MKFINLNGVVGKARRFISRPSSVSADEVKDPAKLAETLRQISARLAELESKVPPDAVEFEFNSTIGGTKSLAHNFGGPVRWYITYWRDAAVASGPDFTEASSSDANNLVLLTNTAGRAIVRIEPAQSGLT